MPTLLWDCGTARLFEEQRYDHVYRTADYTPSNNVAAALYLLKDMPQVKTIAGINQDYAFGRDNWAAFKEAVQALRPDVKFVAELFPKLGTADYSTEISRLSALRPGMGILFISGYPGKHVPDSLERSPQVDYLAKPFKVDVLLEKVKKLLG